MILKKLAGFFLALTILVASMPLSAMAATNSTGCIASISRVNSYGC